MARKFVKKGGKPRRVPMMKKVTTKITMRPRKAKIFRVPTGFPTSRLVRMRYCENYSMTSTLGIMNSYTFRCNSIYDPNQTGVGHECFGRDQWATFYNKYVVLGAKIKIVAQGGGSSNTGSVPVYTGIKRDLDNSIASDYNTLKEQGTASRVFQPAGEAKLVLTSYYSAKKHWGVSSVKDNLDRLGALFTTNPTDQMYFVHFYQTQDRGSTSLPTVFTATIDYIVLCFEPKDLPGS